MTRDSDNSPPSYHDLHITTADLARRSVFDLPYSYRVTCTRAGGWELWHISHNMALGALPAHEELLAGEYHTKGLRLDVAGHVIVDSLKS